VTRFEVSGFTIEGPNQHITHEEAMADRLLHSPKYSGRGIAIWSGAYIHIHHNVVSNAPNSCLRANNADYVTIEDNVVANCTWWSSSAESGIVLASALHVDTLDIEKMILRRNVVYGCINKIPYYNSHYDDPAYLAANQMHVAREFYGSSNQTFIIDGSGVYITRNSQSYLYGRFLLADNIAYGNGINGLVVHKTARARVINNLLYDNGKVSRDLPSDRQHYAGLTLNQALDVLEISNNNVSAPYDDDNAFTMDSVGTFHPSFVSTRLNYVCRGEVDQRNSGFTAVIAVQPSCIPPPSPPPAPPTPPSPPFPPPSPPPCYQCTNTRSNYMITNDKYCETWGFMSQECNLDATWVSNRFCEYSCDALGLGYNSELSCCPPSPPASPPSPPMLPSPPSPPDTCSLLDSRTFLAVANQGCETLSTAQCASHYTHKPGEPAVVYRCYVDGGTCRGEERTCDWECGGCTAWTGNGDGGWFGGSQAADCCTWIEQRWTALYQSASPRLSCSFWSNKVRLLREAGAQIAGSTTAHAGQALCASVQTEADCKLAYSRNVVTAASTYELTLCKWSDGACAEEPSSKTDVSGCSLSCEVTEELTEDEGKWWGSAVALGGGFTVFFLAIFAASRRWARPAPPPKGPHKPSPVINWVCQMSGIGRSSAGPRAGGAVSSGSAASSVRLTGIAAGPAMAESSAKVCASI